MNGTAMNYEKQLFIAVGFHQRIIINSAKAFTPFTYLPSAKADGYELFTCCIHCRWL